MTSNADSLKRICYAYYFYPKKLRKAAEDAKRKYPKSQTMRLTEVLNSLSKQEKSLVDKYWKYDEALIDGGYTFERLRVCHGADIKLRNGETLEKYARTHDKNKEWGEKIRKLYQEDVDHVSKGGILHDLHREYCYPRPENRLKKEDEPTNVKVRANALDIAENLGDEKFHDYIRRMTGLSYKRLWPDARWLLSESWKYDKHLLKESGPLFESGTDYICSCYSYERLKVCRSFDLEKFGNEYRGVFPIYTNNDTIEEIQKAMRNHYKEEGGDGNVFNNFVSDLDFASIEMNWELQLKREAKGGKKRKASPDSPKYVKRRKKK